MISILSLKDKAHYLPHSQVLPAFRDISFWIEPCWRSFKDRHHNLSDVYRYWDSLVTFYLLFMLDLFRFVVLHEETMIRCNLLFDLIDHFGLLKYVNIPYFLSCLLSGETCIPIFSFVLTSVCSIEIFWWCLLVLIFVSLFWYNVASLILSLMF